MVGDASSMQATDDERRALLERARHRWTRDQAPDAKAFLAEYPQWRLDRGLTLELAYEEYCQRRDRGQVVERSVFCDRFPSIRGSLYRQLEVEEYLRDRLGSEGADASLDARLMMWPRPGERFLGFELIDEIGRGAFARAYLCREPGVGDRQVVVKLANAGAAEARMLGQLDHPHIMPIHSVQADPVSGMTAICMPFRGRSTLQDVLDLAHIAGGSTPRHAGVILQAARSRSCGIDRCQQVAGTVRFRSGETYVTGVLRLALQMAEALRHAHSRGIVHGDLKPSNVVVSIEGMPLLVDFNLARGSGAEFQRFGGTLPYMAPEQLALVLAWHDTAAAFTGETLVASTKPDDGSLAPCDGRADLFAWAVLVWELLTGKLPWDPGQPSRDGSGREAMEEHYRALRNTTPTWPAGVTVDRPVRELLLHCLAPDPDARPLHLHEVCGTLRRQLGWTRRWTREARGMSPTRRLLAASTLAAVALATYVSLQPPSLDQRLQQAKTLYARQDFPAAVESLNQILLSHPDCAEAYLDRACCSLLLFERDGYRLRLDAASGDLTNALRLQDSLDAQHVQAYCLMKQGDFDAAVGAYRLLLEKLEMNDVESLNNLAYCYEKTSIKLRDPAEIDVYVEESDKLLKRATALAPGEWKVHLNRAILGLRRLRRSSNYMPLGELESVRQCLSLNDKDAATFYVASTLALVVGLRSSDQNLVGEGLQYAEGAARRGHRFAPSGGEPTVFAYPFSEVASDPRFVKAVAMPSTGVTATTADRMIRPSYLKDLSD